MSLPNVHMLLGNHEYMMLNALDVLDRDNPEYPHALRLWYRNGGDVTHEYIKHIRKSVRKEIFDYLHSLPLNIDVEVNGKSYILVHGGAIAHYDRYAFKYDTQEEYAVWNRIHYKAPDIEGKTIIFGHTPTSEYQHNNPLEIWHSPSGGKIGIDCGCGFPHSLSQGRYPAYGRLACLRLDDMKVFYSEEEIHEEVGKKLYGNLAQPKVDHYIEWLRRNDHFGMTGCIYDDKSNELLDELFSLLNRSLRYPRMEPELLWLRAERGPIEDFGNAEEEIAAGNYKSEEEFIEEWKSWFPEEIEWYQLQAVDLKDEKYRAVMVKHKFVVVQDERREPSGYPNEIAEFVQWMVDGVKECIEMLKAGTYNDFIRGNLPPQHRTGTILRKDFWDVWPEARAEFFENISSEDVSEFIRKASLQETAPKL